MTVPNDHAGTQLDSSMTTPDNLRLKRFMRLMVSRVVSGYGTINSSFDELVLEIDCAIDKSGRRLTEDTKIAVIAKLINEMVEDLGEDGDFSAKVKSIRDGKEYARIEAFFNRL